MNTRIIGLHVVLLVMLAAASLPAQDSLQLKFMRAVSLSDLKSAKELLHQGADANMSIVSGDPMYLFIVSRRLYLEGLAKTRPGEQVYVSPIHANAIAADIKMLDLLRKKRANIDAGDSDGKTPLMYALRNPGGETYALDLLKRGANYRSKDNLGNTAMHYAAYGGNREGLRMCAGGGIDINVRNVEGITPLHAAAVFSSIAVMEEIVGLGGDIHALDSVGMGILHYAAAYSDRDKLEWILENAPEQNTPAINGYSPLDIARSAGNKEGAEFLVSKGGKLNAFRYPEMIAAIEAHQHGDLEKALAEGANVSRRGDKDLPLILAVREGDHVSVELLVKAGATVDCRSREGESPLDITIAGGHPFTASALLKAGAVATKENMGQCLDQLLAKGSPPSNVVSLVIGMATRGGFINVPAGKLMATPLHYAAYLGLEGMVDSLLAAGANVNVPDTSGWTALHWTVMKRDIMRLHLDKLHIAERLLAAGAEVNPHGKYPKLLPHKDPYLARRVPAGATPWDLLTYCPPKDLDLLELLTAKGGATGMHAADLFENGLKLFEAKEFQSAMLEFNRAIVEDPTLPEAYYFRARCLSMTSMYAEVERDLSKTLEFIPTHTHALIGRARARIELEKYEEAKADVKQAIELGYEPGEAYYWLGKIRLRLDDRNGACADFRESGANGYQDGVQAVLLYCK
ncbi:MAG: ankyrin repeat domain-containing protein [Bacteroidia bacterium]